MGCPGAAVGPRLPVLGWTGLWLCLWGGQSWGRSPSPTHQGGGSPSTVDGRPRSKEAPVPTRWPTTGKVRHGRSVLVHHRDRSGLLGCTGWGPFPFWQHRGTWEFSGAPAAETQPLHRGDSRAPLAACQAPQRPGHAQSRGERRLPTEVPSGASVFLSCLCRLAFLLFAHTERALRFPRGAGLSSRTDHSKYLLSATSPITPYGGSPAPPPEKEDAVPNPWASDSPQGE